MAKECSFDIAAKVDIQEVKNAIDQAKREIGTRFDFKNDKAKEVDLEEKAKIIVITADSENRAETIFDILVSKTIKREIPTSAITKEKTETVGGGKTKMTVKINDSLTQEHAKKIVAEIKNAKLKAQPSIQGDVIRVKGKSKDELQAAIALVRGLEIEAPLVFENYR